jgi:dUTP pyrophosphatase
MKVGFKKLYDDSIIPSYGNGDESNAGLDLYAHYGATIHANSSAIFGTGVAWEPFNWAVGYKPFLLVNSRSGLAFNSGVEASNAGVVDVSYRGEIKVKLYNNTDKDVFINKGDRIAQGIVMEIPHVEVTELADLAETTRGDKGFGSSGK